MPRLARRSWSDISGDVPHPREGYTFRHLPAEHQEMAHQAMASLSERGPEFQGQIHAELERHRTEVAGMKASGTPVPVSKYKRMDILRKAHEESVSIPETGMEASVGRIKETAMAPVRAVRAHARKTGEMAVPLAGEYFGARSRIGRGIAEETFGAGTEASLRHQMASPVLSARMGPQKEVEAAAGLASVLKHGSEIGMHIEPHVAASLGIPGGRTNFASLAARHPKAAALLLQHGARQSGLVVPQSASGIPQGEGATARSRREMLESGAKVHIPEDLAAPTRAFVRGYGITGYPKGGRALAQFHADPGAFGGQEYHKIPSYTWNILHGEDVAAGTHHFLGAMAHGQKWFEAHPQAESKIRKATAHPTWSDPTTTVDVWSGRAASGLPYHVARGLGEHTNPEDIMGFAGLKGLRKPPGTAMGGAGASNLGYLWGEEAHRQVGESLRVRLPGGGHVAAPAHVAQSLSWYGIQAQEYPGKIKSGEKTLVPRRASDPRGLNPLQFPKVWS